MTAVNVRGVYNTKANTVPPDMVPPNAWHGKIRCALDTYEANAVDAGSTIKGPIIPKGARIIGGKLMTDDLSADATISVGISGTAAKYLTAQVCTTANQIKDFNVIDSLGEELTAAEEILLTTGVSAITGTIKIMVFYVME